MAKPYRRTYQQKQYSDHARLGVDWRIAKYETEKRRWQDQNPNATPAEYSAAMTAIASACGV